MREEETVDGHEECGFMANLLNGGCLHKLDKAACTGALEHYGEKSSVELDAKARWIMEVGTCHRS